MDHEGLMAPLSELEAWSSPVPHAPLGFLKSSPLGRGNAPASSSLTPLGPCAPLPHLSFKGFIDEYVCVGLSHKHAKGYGRMRDLLELELQVTVSCLTWALGTKLQSSRRTRSPLSCLAISLGPCFSFTWSAELSSLGALLPWGFLGPTSSQVMH